MWKQEKAKAGLKDDADLKKVREKIPWLTEWYDKYLASITENRSEESAGRAVSTIVADLNKIVSH